MLENKTSQKLVFRFSLSLMIADLLHAKMKILLIVFGYGTFRQSRSTQFWSRNMKLPQLNGVQELQHWMFVLGRVNFIFGLSKVLLSVRSQLQKITFKLEKLNGIQMEKVSPPLIKMDSSSFILSSLFMMKELPTNELNTLYKFSYINFNKNCHFIVSSIQCLHRWIVLFLTP